MPDSKLPVEAVVHDLFPMWGASTSNSSPSDMAYFGVVVSLLIGTVDRTVSDMFGCFVCSPQWLADHFPEGEPLASLRQNWGLHWGLDTSLFGSGLILMAAWSEDTLRQTIEEWCANCRGPDWGTVAARIGRLLPWERAGEFDDFVNRHPSPASWPPAR